MKITKNQYKNDAEKKIDNKNDAEKKIDKFTNCDEAKQRSSKIQSVVPYWKA